MQIVGRYLLLYNDRQNTEFVDYFMLCLGTYLKNKLYFTFHLTLKFVGNFIFNIKGKTNCFKDNKKKYLNLI